MLVKNYDIHVISLISPGLGQSQANFLAFGLARDFTKPKLPKARPKPGLSGQAGAGTSLNPSSHSFDNHFDTRINLAAGAIHALDPASVNETETISDADQSMEQTSTEDEDPNEEVVNDMDVFAEVKLPLTIR